MSEIVNPTPSINRTSNVEPTLSDLIDLTRREIFLSLNCHAIATIDSFNPVKQTVSASIAYNQTYLERGADKVYRNVQVPYPFLIDVPVMFLNGGPAALTFPVTKGDTCVILFNDRDLDNWFQSGQVTSPASTRLHSFSDGIAIVGLRPATSALQNFDMNHAQIAWGETAIGVSANKLKLENAVESLADILKDLVAQIQLITVVAQGPFNPTTVPVNAAAFSAIATRIGNLIE